MIALSIVGIIVERIIILRASTIVVTAIWCTNIIKTVFIIAHAKYSLSNLLFNFNVNQIFSNNFFHHDNFEKICLKRNQLKIKGTDTKKF